MNAIGGINDSHIVEFADVKPQKKSAALWVKIVSAAACLAIILCALPIALNYIEMTKDKIPPLNVFVVNESYYETVTDKNVLSAHGLPEKADKTMLGEYLGTINSLSGKKKVEVYDYLPYNGTSVLVMACEENYFFMLYCNRSDSTEAINFSELLKIYGLDEPLNIESIGVNGNIITDAGVMTELISALSESKAITGDMFNATVFDGKTEEEQIDLSKNTPKIDFIIYGESADTLCFKYYVDLGYLESALMYYQLTPTATEIISNIINK